MYSCATTSTAGAAVNQRQIECKSLKMAAPTVTKCHEIACIAVVLHTPETEFKTETSINLMKP